MRRSFVVVLALAASACSASSSGAAPAPQSAPPPVAASVAPAAPAAAVETAPAASPSPVTETSGPKGDPMPTPTVETATFGTGCYWCTEAVFQRIPGVLSVRSGFTGGTVPNPTYEQCCSGETGHAEAVELTFDPKKVSYDTLLDWFWRMHDPTTLNRQGADVGTQYRSAIFWHSEAQRAAAEASKKEAQGAFADPIVTEITRASAFYAAEAYHQNYYNDHTTQGYCRAVIAPKLKKLGLHETK